MKSLLEYKGLIYQLAMRDLKLRYRKPFLGFFWMLIIPFCTALVYKVLFSDFMGAQNGPYPFFVYLITAILPWNYFASSIQSSARSIIDSKNIINQISFPKYLLPVSIVLANLINFLPSLLVLLGFIVAFHIKIPILIIFLPVIILIQTGLIIGLSLLVSALQVVYRDVEYVIQVMLMVFFFLTPAVYPLEEVISKSSPFFTKIYMLNPLVGILNLYRIVSIGGYLNNLPKEANLLNTLVLPVLSSIAVLFLGYFVFHKYEKRFSDYLNI